VRGRMAAVHVAEVFTDIGSFGCLAFGFLGIWNVFVAAR
jgi:hypothetical protein